MNKPKIKLFLSYAHKDEGDTKMVTTFLEELQQCFKASKRYEYEVWADWGLLIGEEWDKEIKSSLAECDYGLMLVSLPFLNSDYIAKNELPDLLSSGRALPIGFRKLDIDKFDLQGILPKQIFRHEGKFYSELRGGRKNDFIHELFSQIEAKLQKFKNGSQIKKGAIDSNGELINLEVNNGQTNEGLNQPEELPVPDHEDTGDIKKTKTKKILIGAASFVLIGLAYLATQFINVKPEPIKLVRPKPTEIVVLADNLTLVPIREGKFEMGDKTRSPSEKPVRTVTFDRNFWMSQTEITFAQYDAYLKKKPRERIPADEKWGREDRPVINVNWHEAKAFTSWLTESNERGLNCRLPSEAEWEYAARGETQMSYFWGEKVGTNNANCVDCDSQWEGKKRTSPVGKFKPNSFKLLDMHGNVAEWVEDIWHADYQGAPVNGEARKFGKKTARRVLRGGSWGDLPDDIRSAHRASGPPEERFNSVGLRVVCQLDKS